MFFVSWALWEKMTFCLGVAILVVFFIGWFKLVWTNRLVRRQEVDDEERRIRIQELRSRGQIVEESKNDDVPFGVRALQSGVQVAGIWVSSPSTPVPDDARNLEAGTMGRGTSDKYTKIPSGETIPLAVKPTSKKDSPLSKGEHGGLPFSHLGETREPTNMDRPSPSANRTSYKPQRSSQLRYGSQGDYNEDALNQLEGKTTPKKKSYAQRSRSSNQPEKEADSSAADNERSSGTSSDSDATLSQQRDYVEAERARYSLTSQLDEFSPSPSYSPTGKGPRISHPGHSSKMEYFSVPSTDSANLETSDPFATPMASPYETLRSSNAGESSRPVEKRPTEKRPADRESVPFISGELHVNKSVRKVNSGFEVLPAGTFDVVDTKGKAIDYDQHGSPGDKRHSTRLQKKPRDSTDRRASSTMDRP